MTDPYGVNSLVGTAVTLPVLAIVSVLLRFYVRLRMRHTFLGVDDWLVMLSVLLVCGQGIIQILGMQRSVPFAMPIFIETMRPPLCLDPNIEAH